MELKFNIIGTLTKLKNDSSKARGRLYKVYYIDGRFYIKESRQFIEINEDSISLINEYIVFKNPIDRLELEEKIYNLKQVDPRQVDVYKIAQLELSLSALPEDWSKRAVSKKFTDNSLFKSWSIIAPGITKVKGKVSEGKFVVTKVIY